MMDIFIYEAASNSSHITDWITAIGTLIAAGGAGLGVYKYFQNKEREQENIEREDQQFWQQYYPILNISSPCDTSQNSCELNIANNKSVLHEERGSMLFCIYGMNENIAYDVVVTISACKDFTAGSPLRRHYISNVNHFMYDDGEKEVDDNGKKKKIKISGMEYMHGMVYSKYHVDPETKEVQMEDFKICDFVKQCPANETATDCKYLYVRLEYATSPLLEIAKKITSTFSLCIQCGTETTENADKETQQKIPSVTIKNITRLCYETS